MRASIGDVEPEGMLVTRRLGKRESGQTGVPEQPGQELSTPADPEFVVGVGKMRLNRVLGDRQPRGDLDSNRVGRSRSKVFPKVIQAQLEPNGLPESEGNWVVLTNIQVNAVDVARRKLFDDHFDKCAAIAPLSIFVIDVKVADRRARSIVVLPQIHPGESDPGLLRNRPPVDAPVVIEPELISEVHGTALGILNHRGIRHQLLPIPAGHRPEFVDVACRYPGKCHGRHV